MVSGPARRSAATRSLENVHGPAKLPPPRVATIALQQHAGGKENLNIASHGNLVALFSGQVLMKMNYMRLVNWGYRKRARSFISDTPMQVWDMQSGNSKKPSLMSLRDGDWYPWRG